MISTAAKGRNGERPARPGEQAPEGSVPGGRFTKPIYPVTFDPLHMLAPEGIVLPMRREIFHSRAVASLLA